MSWKSPWTPIAKIPEKKQMRKNGKGEAQGH